MTIAVGDTIPDVRVMVPGPDRPTPVQTGELLGSGKVVLFAVPGAFTPTCSDYHLPSYLLRNDELKAKGVDKVVCVSVNDPFVMDAWGKQHEVGDKVVMVADGSAALTKALGLELDLTARGMGVRSQRYALVAEDGKVTHLAVEAPGGFEVSRAESILAAI